MQSKYEAIAADIQRSIEDETLKPGDKLPTVVEFCNLYGVSKITVKRALDKVAELGLVTSKRGSGTYVKETSGLPSGMQPHARSDRASGFSAEHKGKGDEVTSVVYEFSVKNPPENIAPLLNLTTDDFAYYHCRTRLLNGVPIVIEYTYMPLELIPGLKKKQLYGSVYSYINKTLGLKISSFHRTVRAVKATAEEAERLEIEAGDPLLELEQVGFLDSGVPFEYSISRNVGNRYELHNVTLA